MLLAAGSEFISRRKNHFCWKNSITSCQQVPQARILADVKVPEKEESILFIFKKIYIYLFLERGGGRMKERERNINV